MQYKITDRAALEFAQSLYESLADGLPVEAAVAEARKAISIGVANSVEWGTPVLYSRASDGLLFDLAAVPAPRAKVDREAANAPPSAPLKSASSDGEFFGGSNPTVDKGAYREQPRAPVSTQMQPNTAPPVQISSAILPAILNAGDWLCDLEIIKPIIVLRSGALYEAYRQKRKVYLKVAHPGAENGERLKREAEFLQSLQLRKLYQQTLPRLLPAYANTTIALDAYGKTMLRDDLLYFYLFEPFEGEPLRDALRRNPQLWINHVGWLMITLAATVNYLHLQGRYHFGLSPDSLLVRFDEKPSVPRILLFDLGVVTDKVHLNRDWHAFAVPPAYRAPELIGVDPGQILADYRTDVYGLGLVLYELLVGQPAFPHNLRGDDKVLQAVKHGQRVAMNRIVDVRPTAQITLQATSLEPAERQASAYEFVQQLRALFGDVPSPRRSLKNPFAGISAS